MSIPPFQAVALAAHPDPRVAVVAGESGLPAVALTEADLLAPFISGEQPPSRWRIGLEHEKLAVRADGTPVPYHGANGVEMLLRGFARDGFLPVLDHGHLIGLSSPGGRHGSVSLEPGCQVEQSAPPTESVAASVALVRAHLTRLREDAARLGITFIHGGFRPFGGFDDVPWLPKRRYDFMREFLPRQGRLGVEMMKRTATVQFNFDYGGEADAMERLRTANAVSSIVTAMAASSPISEGKKTGYQSYRAAVWLETDERRCGLWQAAFAAGSGYSDYADFALDAPIFFVVRDGVYLDARGKTFREFMRTGLPGEGGTLRASKDDWELHLSTLFPEVRLKNTIEVRGADAAPLPIAFGLAALWRGLLDDPGARAAAFELAGDVTWDERVAARRAVPRGGLAARLGRHGIGDLAVRLCAIARDGVSRLPHGDGDAAFLDPLQELLASGRSPADLMLEDFDRAGGDPAQLVARWAL